MSSHTARALHHRATQGLSQGLRAIVVTVADIKGSTPRDTGTRMLVSKDEVQGTIGGGHLEWQAIDMARQALGECAGALATWQHTFPLGPTLGQCCGGIVTLRFEWLTDAALQRWLLPPPRLHVELHGAGHVGQAIIHLLADLDCTVRWIDMREHMHEGSTPLPGLPSQAMLHALPAHITWLPSDAPQAEVAEAPAAACHLVLTHRHDLDLRIIEAVLQREDAAFAGLIGSQTKRARFLHRLAEKGLSPAQLDAMTCPIGLPGLGGKEPAVIAIAVVAQLLQLMPASPPTHGNTSL
jgi:xanthine dehydrogenase accessory factor